MSEPVPHFLGLPPDGTSIVHVQRDEDVRQGVCGVGVTGDQRWRLFRVCDTCWRIALEGEEDREFRRVIEAEARRAYDLEGRLARTFGLDPDKASLADQYRALRGDDR